MPLDDRPGFVGQPGSRIRRFDEFRRASESQHLRDHLVVPGPLDVEDRGAIRLESNLLARVKGLLACPFDPLRRDSNPVSARRRNRAVEGDAVGEERRHAPAAFFETAGGRLHAHDPVDLEETEGTAARLRLVGHVGPVARDVDAAVVDDQGLRLDQIAARLFSGASGVVHLDRHAVRDRAIDRVEHRRSVFSLGR